MKEWIKAHLAEMVGAVAALGLLILVWLNSRKSSGTVAPASGAIQTPPISSGSSGGSSGPTGPSASDVQAAITSALQGYARTSDVQAAIGQSGADLNTAFAAAISQAKQAETQDAQTAANNFQGLSQQFSQLSQTYAAFANQQKGINDQQSAAAANIAASLASLSDVVNSKASVQQVQNALNRASSEVYGGTSTGEALSNASYTAGQPGNSPYTVIHGNPSNGSIYQAPFITTVQP